MYVPYPFSGMEFLSNLAYRMDGWMDRFIDRSMDRSISIDRSMDSRAGLTVVPFMPRHINQSIKHDNF